MRQPQRNNDSNAFLTLNEMIKEDQINTRTSVLPTSRKQKGNHSESVKIRRNPKHCGFKMQNRVDCLSISEGLGTTKEVAAGSAMVCQRRIQWFFSYYNTTTLYQGHVPRRLSLNFWPTLSPQI